MFKVLALQSLHGWERYVVCFKRNPSAAEAKRYAEAGLVFCTEATLAQVLAVIDLATYGLYFPFALCASRSGYSIIVNPIPNRSMQASRVSRSPEPTAQSMKP